MAFVRTEAHNAKYRANRRKKYAEDAEYRAMVNARNKAIRAAKRDEINAARRERWNADPEYRERQLAPRRGRCQRDGQLKTHYGISLAEYREMHERQGAACAICKEPSSETLCVDHCHTSGAVRGLLCRKCNTGLGCFQDDPLLMTKAMDYLRKHRGH